MSKSTKAALLSAFVFPGVGHFFVKKYMVGMALAGASLVGIYWLVTQVVERAQQITAQIQRGEVPLDVATITELVAQQPTGAEAQMLDLATGVLIVAWIIGIVDSYRVGRAQQNAA